MRNLPLVIGRRLLIGSLLAAALASAAHAENRCEELPSLLAEPTASAELVVELDPSFRRLPQVDQRKHLNAVKESLALLPPLVRQLINEAHFKVVLLGNSLADIPELAARLKASGREEILTRPGLFSPRERSVFVVVNEGNEILRRNSLPRVLLHELGHAFDHAVGGLRARKNKEASYDPFSLTSPEFASAHREAYPLIKNSGIESSKEFFADMFYYYFSSAKGRVQLRENVPATYAIFEGWFGEECKR